MCNPQHFATVVRRVGRVDVCRGVISSHGSGHCVAHASIRPSAPQAEAGGKAKRHHEDPHPGHGRSLLAIGPVLAIESLFAARFSPRIIAVTAVTAGIAGFMGFMGFMGIAIVSAETTYRPN